MMGSQHYRVIISRQTNNLNAEQGPISEIENMLIFCRLQRLKRFDSIVQ